MTVKHILVPTDFSPSSRLASSWAALLARRFEAQFTLLHCLDLPERDWTNLDGLSPDLRTLTADLLETARERLHEELGALSLGKGHEPNVRARSGVPVREILGEVRESSVDLVVAATQGRTGIARSLLGSVVEKLVRDCPCPVLTVKAGEEPPDEDIAGVLFPTDFSAGSLAALAPAIEMAQALGGALTAVHVIQEPNLSIGTVQQVFGITPEELQARFEKRARQAARLQVQALLPEGLEFHVKLLGGVAHEEIVREASEGGHGLVVMGTNGSSGLTEVLLGSTAERVVRSSTIPVMTVRGEAAGG